VTARPPSGDPHCPECDGPLDDRRRCWKCCERLCPCGRPTGSAFIELCVYCALAAAPFHKYVPAPADASRGATRTLPVDCRWLGYVRGEDGEWHPVVEAGTREVCWQALMTTWQDGDKLLVPVWSRGREGR
jgi:hypothetical protein